MSPEPDDIACASCGNWTSPDFTICHVCGAPPFWQRATVSEETISQGHILYHVMVDGKSAWTRRTREEAESDCGIINAADWWDGPMGAQSAAAIVERHRKQKGGEA